MIAFGWRLMVLLGWISKTETILGQIFRGGCSVFKATVT